MLSCLRAFRIRSRLHSGLARSACALTFLLVVALAAGLTTAVPTSALAQSAEVPLGWELKPSGLVAGDSFRLLFLSSTKRGTGSTEIDDYNTFIQDRAAAGHTAIRTYSAGFRVVGSTEDVDARDNTATTYTNADKGVPIYWLGGDKAADDYEDFYDGSWDEEANDKNESGSNGPDTSVRSNYPATGSDHDGTEYTALVEVEVGVILPTTSALGSGSVRVGRPDSSDAGHGPLSASTDAAFGGSDRPLYGLSQALTVAVASSDATLSGLALKNTSEDSAVALRPTFASGKTAYRASVAVSRLTVMATVSHAGASAAIQDGSGNALADADSDPSNGHQASLELGENTITVVVTAEDTTTTETYTVTVTRRVSTDATLSALSLSEATLTPAFVPARTDYAALAANRVSETTVTATTNHSYAMVAFLDETDAALADANTGIEGFQVPLAAGDENTFKVRVTAEDRSTTETWTVTVTRAAPRAHPDAPKLIKVRTVRTNRGNSEHTFDLQLSERVFVKVPHLREHGFEVTDGRMVHARRMNIDCERRLHPDGKRRMYCGRYQLTVRSKDRYRPVTVTLPANRPCNEPGALCDAQGTSVARHEASKSWPGATDDIAVSIADTAVAEPTTEGCTDRQMLFDVKLSKKSKFPVYVDFETVGGGTATPNTPPDYAGDYWPNSYTILFIPGQKKLKAGVHVCKDMIDDNGETVVVRLSNARLMAGRRKLKDLVITNPVATGTINNTGPMPRAWLARFGRTVGEQVLDAVKDRIAAAPQPGVAISFAGQRIGSGAKLADGTPKAETAEARARLAAMTDWQRGGSAAGTHGNGHRAVDARPVTGRDLLTGTSFALTAQGPGGGHASLWGRGALTRFDGREDALILDGEVTTGMLGADWTRERWTAGLAVAHTRGEGGYRGEGQHDRGTIEAILTGVWPYGRYALNDQVTLWGVAGYGNGTLTLTPDGLPAMRTDIDLTMGALGLHGVLLKAPAAGGPELAATSDAMAVRTASAAYRSDTGNLAASQADVTRLRLGLEGTWRGLRLGGGALAPRLELGLRHDGGDAETGFGLDLGGGLAWTHEESGIAAQVSGRGLLIHEAGGFRERGVAGSLTFDPRPESERGMRLTLRQTMGAQASGGMDALLGRTTLAGLAANDNGNDLQRQRLALKLGYGFPAFAGRFTSIPEAALGLSDSAREYSLGWRLTLTERSSNVLELGIEARRREPAYDDREPEHAIGLRLAARW